MSKLNLVALGLALGGGAVFGMISCESVPLTAAPGTMMTLIANPTFVAANGGTSVVTAILVEPAGTFVPDGVEIFFFTDLGHVDASGKTRNGIARVNFVADSRSGTATITAISGGPAPAPAPSPTPTPESGSVGVPQAGEGSDQVTITIGSALPATVLVTANPQLLAGSRAATVVANVFDGSGNPVRNVPVLFTVSGTPLQEFLSSGGAPQFTDSSGQALDTLSTRAPNGPDQKTVTVTATTPNGTKGEVTVAVNYTKTPEPTPTPTPTPSPSPTP
jgi:hypothetical protein